jgi:hypothetical protein
MMKLFLLLAVLLAAGCQTTSAAPACGKDLIVDLDSAGTVMRLDTGLIYRVYPGQDANVKFWEPQDKVIVCPEGGTAVKITDLDRKGQTVQALRQF